MTRIIKIIKGADGKLRKFFIDSEGYAYGECYAKDVQTTFVVGDHINNNQFTAQQLIEECDIN